MLFVCGFFDIVYKVGMLENGIEYMYFFKVVSVLVIVDGFYYGYVGCWGKRKVVFEGLLG